MNHFPLRHAHGHILHHPEHLLAVSIAHPSKFGKEASRLLFCSSQVPCTDNESHRARPFFLKTGSTHKLAAAHPAMLQIPQQKSKRRAQPVSRFFKDCCRV